MAIALEVLVEPRRGETGGSSAGEAFADTYASTFGPLVDYCRRLTPDRTAAEDLAQESLCRAWASWRRYAPDRPFWPWVATIARRLSIDEHRKAQRAADRRHAVAALHEHRPAAPDEVVESNDERELVMRALRRLPAGQQRVLGLREIDGWSYEEIARFEGTSLTSVRSRLFRARAALRQAFEDLGGAVPVAVPGLWWRLRDRADSLLGRLRARTASVPPSSMTGAGDAAAAVLAVMATLAVGAGGAPAQLVELRGAPVSNLAAAPTPAAAPMITPAAPAVTETTAAAPGEAAAPVAAPAPALPHEITVFSSVTPSPSYAVDHTLFAMGEQAGGCGGSCVTLHRSIDRGASWERLPSAGLSWGQILLPPAFPADDRIFVAAPAALLVSTDGGASFAPVATVGGPAAMSPAFSAGDPRILVGGAPGWEYDDATGVASPVVTGTAGGLRQVYAFAPEYPHDRRLVVAANGSGMQPEASVSVCDGVACGTPVPVPGLWGTPSVTLSPTVSRDHTMFVWTAAGMARSADGGGSFEPVDLPAAGDIRAVAATHDFVYAALERRADGSGTGAVVVSADGGATWRVAAEPAFAHGVRWLTALPTGHVLAAVNQHGGGGIRCSADGGLTWHPTC